MRVSASQLYDAYRSWCIHLGSTSVTMKAFARNLRAHPALTWKKSHGSIVWNGVDLKEGDGTESAGIFVPGFGDCGFRLS